MDLSKADVVERLGMGSGGAIFGKGRISHSVASGIKAIPQEGISRNGNQITIPSRRSDEWEIIDKDLRFCSKVLRVYEFKDENWDKKRDVRLVFFL